MIARIGAPGRHMVQNVLAVLGAAQLVGADLDKVAIALNDLSAERGRGKRHVLRHPGGSTSSHPGGPITLIDESYNANPASMAATLKVLGEEKIEGRRIAVLGSMRELGPDSDDFHRALAGRLEEAGVDYAILVGREMEALARELGEKALGGQVKMAHVPDAASALPLARAAIGPGDALLVKGSNAIGLAALVEALAGGTD